mgnify:CR=1 FL=1
MKRTIQEFLRYPSAIAGSIIILVLVLIGVYALISIPYSEALRLWRGGEDVWYENPKLAPPAWTNWLRRDKLPVSFTLRSTDSSASKTVEAKSGGKSILITYTFDYNSKLFPQEMALYLKAAFTEKKPYVSMTWLTPDGREIRVADFSSDSAQTYRFSQDTKLQRRLQGVSPVKGLFVVDPSAENLVASPGTYQLNVKVTTFEENSDLDAEFVLYGQVAGWAGTDHQRRDLGVALLWGIPIALSFGLIAAVGTSLVTMMIAALGAWYGGWVDEIIQRITEVNLVLPFLPILIMIGTFYNRSIWTILGATILLSIFTAGIKTDRAIFLQIKESPYIEAARSYGASNGRIVLRYLMPRLIPLLVPRLVGGIPGFVFLEAALAFLGLGDPVLPTWGKVINDAYANGALYQGLYYWILEPAVLLAVTGLAFAMLGFSLDRVFNPRLRGM